MVVRGDSLSMKVEHGVHAFHRRNLLRPFSQDCVAVPQKVKPLPFQIHGRFRHDSQRNSTSSTRVTHARGRRVVWVFMAATEKIDHQGGTEEHGKRGVLLPGFSPRFPIYPFLNVS